MSHHVKNEKCPRNGNSESGCSVNGNQTVYLCKSYEPPFSKYLELTHYFTEVIDMKQVILTEQKPIKLWLNDIEDGALEQAKNLANLPFIFRHVAIMPDSHQGYGMPIGGVMATQSAVVPNAVGVDIGCGMCAVRTSTKNICTDDLKKVMGLIRKAVPVGFEHHKTKQPEILLPNYEARGVVRNEREHALYQIGTLGGGNHFIELQKGDDGFIWIMIHSGSRNLGFKVAKYYNDLAVSLNEKWHTGIPKECKLAFLPRDSVDGQNYLAEMQYCVDFALANRRLIMDRVKACVTDIVGEISFYDMINTAHNYAAMENHFGKNVMVHRKGATKAYNGQLGIIPGSQGTASYIVTGKGNPESFMSCSHGAGRIMGRRQAQRELNFDEQKRILDDAGVIHGMMNKKDLDEAPGSYKDISVVMNNQTDLVDIKVELRPLAVIKG